MGKKRKQNSSRGGDSSRERRRKQHKAEKAATKVEGIVSMNRDGLGFITTKEYPESIFVGVNKMRGALNGDRVKVGVYHRTRNGRLEGEIICVLERSHRPHIGTLLVRGNKVWAIVESRTMPYDIRIQVASPDALPTIGGIKAEDGALLICWSARVL